MTASIEHRAQIFESQRARLFSIAYRMTGSRADAEDVVQEGWLRWNSAAASEIRSPGAWLSTVVTRLCLDHLRSAEQTRKEYIGPWLPEPIEHRHDVTDSLSYAFFVTLQMLSPAERCVLLLRDVLGYEYAEIAAILDSSEAGCRKLLARARIQVAAGKARQTADVEKQRDLLRRFARACGTGDDTALVELLARDARLRSDGGGKVRAALNPIIGADRIARFFLGILRKAPSETITVFTTRFGEPALETHLDGRLQSILLIQPDPDTETIREFFAIVNPQKLAASTF